MTHGALPRLYDGVIKFCFVLLFTLVPLLLTPWNYELFEYNKMMAVYALTAIIATAWAVKSIHLHQFRLARTPLDVPIWIFTASQLVSAILSIDVHVSWLGYYSRFNGGMISIASYVILYYAFLSNLDVFAQMQPEGKKTAISLPSLSPVLSGALASGAIVAIYGVLERLGIDKHIWVQDVQNRVFSTMGQPNWLAAYLVSLIPLAMGLALRKGVSRIATSGYWILSVLFFIVLLFTRSRSGLLAFVATDVLFWGIYFFTQVKSKADRHILKKTAATIHVLFALIIFINGTGTPAIDKYVTFGGIRSMIAPLRLEIEGQQAKAPTGPALEVGGTESGTIRKYVWEGAITAWKSTKKTLLIGTGVETFAFAFYQHRPAGHNLTSEWDFLYNKAHNEYLNYLATTGAIGLGSYILLIGAFGWWFVKKVSHGSTPHDHFPVGIALFAGWVSILITNFFGFSVVVVQLGLFLFPAFIFALSQPLRLSTKHITFPVWSGWIAIAIGVYLLSHIGKFWYADKLFATGYHAIRSGNATTAAQSIQQAIALNANEPLYHDELGPIYATLAVAAFEAKNATQASELAGLAVSENTRALSISPNNVNYWKTRTKVYYTLSALDPALNIQAIEALEQGLTLSPNDPKIYYNLAILIGRTGDTNTAIEHLLHAKKLKKNYRDAYFALHVFYTERKETERARAIASEYINTVDPNDKEFLEKAK